VSGKRRNYSHEKGIGKEDVYAREDGTTINKGLKAINGDGNKTEGEEDTNYPRRKSSY